MKKLLLLVFLASCSAPVVIRPPSGSEQVLHLGKLHECDSLDHYKARRVKYPIIEGELKNE